MIPTRVHAKKKPQLPSSDDDDAGPTHAPKYGLDPDYNDARHRPRDQLSPDDELTLKKLASKYGVTLIVTEVKKFEKLHRGRPRKSTQPYEYISLAAYIENRAEEYRLAGHKAPMKAALEYTSQLSKRSVATLTRYLRQGRRTNQKFQHQNPPSATFTKKRLKKSGNKFAEFNSSIRR